MPFYLTPKQDDFNQELQICIAEALYDVDSIVADPGAYTREADIRYPFCACDPCISCSPPLWSGLVKARSIVLVADTMLGVKEIDCGKGE